MDVSRIVAQSIRYKTPIPPAIAAKPELHPANRAYLEAWYALSSTRPLSQGVAGPIPWTAIHEYVNAEFLPSEAAHYLIRSLDNAYLQHVSDKMRRGNS